MFLERLAVTLVLGPLALYLVFLGGLFYFLPVTLILLLATVEYRQLLGRLGWQPALWLLMLANLLLFVDGQWPALGLATPVLLLGLLGFMAVALVRYERRQGTAPAGDWLTGLAGMLLLGWLGSHFFRLRGLADNAWQWTLLALTVIWVADSAAYAYGKRFGRRRLAPRLSPNKTVLGYVAGIVAGSALAVIVANWLGLPPVQGLLVGLVVSTVSPAGDLAISLLKREAGVKDSGHLLPGHGGALDRIDSLLWAVTLTYYVVTLIA